MCGRISSNSNLFVYVVKTLAKLNIISIYIKSVIIERKFSRVCSNFKRVEFQVGVNCVELGRLLMHNRGETWLLLLLLRLG